MTSFGDVNAGSQITLNSGHITFNAKSQSTDTDQTADQTAQLNHWTISTDETQKSQTEVLKLSALRRRENTRNTGELPGTDRDEDGEEQGLSSMVHERIPNRRDYNYSAPKAQPYREHVRSLVRGPSRLPESSSLVDYRDMPYTIKASDHVNMSDDLAAVENKVLRQQVDLLEAKLKKYESTQVRHPRFQFLYQLGDPELNNDSDNSSEDSSNDYKLPVITFTDLPEIAYEKNGAGHLRCSIPLRNFDLFLAMNPDISFLVFRHYEKNLKSHEIINGEASQLPCPTSEYIFPVAREMKSALEVMLDANPGFSDIKKMYRKGGELLAPYLFAYHSRQDIDKIKGQLSPAEIDHMNLFIGYLDEEYSGEYKCVDYLLGKELITPQYIHYLFKPDDILVEKVDDEYTGYVAQSWISKNHEESRDSQPSNIRVVDDISETETSPKPQEKGVFLIRAWKFEFDGQFFRSEKNLIFSLPVTNEEICIEKNTPSKFQSHGNLTKKARPITDLNVFPLKYAPQNVIATLKRRGSTIWKCRTRRLVSYQALEYEKSTEMADERYMIDMETYKKLHPGNTKPRGSKSLTEEQMAQDQPPDERFCFLLPQRTKGYNLRRKKWYEISLDHISDVEWNREAFHSLVIERSAKDMIQALVTNQIETEKSTDLIAGKGNGLILLLHGGPGTGKTLTAESVAEIAQKPLYRVTCGDVGTKAEDVERYLESVLYLGRIWGCVVLLDEADIFLEQRSLEDLERNALVSVFLRVLEYYDGILILTSNRVGTFDEAFRSRIQLALHYPSLGPQQRFRIWQTFVDRLDTMGEDIDIADLRDNLHILKEERLNGRQIRNVITTARQYARWKGTTLTYEHLKEVIRVSGRFDDYLDKLNGGFSPDQIAQDDGVR